MSAPPRSLALVFGIVALVAGCTGLTEEEAQAEFDRVLAQSSTCSLESGCVAVSPGCPLGCWVPVNRRACRNVIDQAQDIIDEYENGGRACQYECVERPAARCIENRCVLRGGADMDAGLPCLPSQ